MDDLLPPPPVVDADAPPPAPRVELPVVTRLSDNALTIAGRADADVVESAPDGSWQLEVHRNAQVNGAPCVAKLVGLRATPAHLRTMAFETEVYRRALTLPPPLAAYLARPVARVSYDFQVGIAVERIGAHTLLLDTVAAFGAQAIGGATPQERRAAEESALALLLQWAVGVVALRSIGLGVAGTLADAVLVPLESEDAVTVTVVDDAAKTRRATYRFPVRQRLVFHDLCASNPLDVVPAFAVAPTRRLHYFEASSAAGVCVQDLLWDIASPWQPWCVPCHAAPQDACCCIEVAAPARITPYPFPWKRRRLA